MMMMFTIVLQMFYYLSWPVRPDRVLWVCLIASLFVRWVKGQFRGSGPGRLEALMAAFTALLITSLVLSGGLTKGGETSTRLNEVFNLSIYPFITYLVARRIPYDRQSAMTVVRTISWIGLYLGVTAIGERLGSSVLVWPPYIMDISVGSHFGRARGPFADAVLMGLNQAVCMIAVLICLQWRPNTLRRVILLLSVLSLLAGIYLTNTRGPWITFAVFLIATCAFRNQARKGASLCIALIVCGFLLGGASKFSLNEGTLFSRRQNTISDREVNYRVALAMGLDNLALGVGLSQMGDHFMRYYERETDLPAFGGWDGNHNEYLGLFAEVGLPALICYVSILFVAIARCIVCIRKATDEVARSLGLLGMCAMLGLVVIGMFNEIRSAPYHICIAYFIAGMAASAVQSAQRTSGRQVSIDPKAAARIRFAGSRAIYSGRIGS